MPPRSTEGLIDPIEAQLLALRDRLHRAETELAREQARLAAIGRLSSDWFWELDATLRFVRCSGGREGADDLAGLLLGRAPWELPGTVPLSGEWDDLHTMLESGRAFSEFVCVTRALGAGERFVALAGEPMAPAGGARAGWHGIARDVSQQHRVHERLRRLAHRDRLTGLPNRAATESALQQMLEDAQADGTRVHVLFVDLDGFKPVNDRLGHAAGDRVLQECAVRLRAALRDEDVLGRFGGDEFVVGLAERRGGGDLRERTAARLREAMAAPFVVDGTGCRLGASIGIASAPEDGAELGALLAHADAEMYAAKRARRGEPEPR